MQRKFIIAAALVGLLVAQSQAFAACSNFGGYARGSSPVVGGFKTQEEGTYATSAYNENTGAQCALSGTVVTSSGFWGSACFTPTSIGTYQYWWRCGSADRNIGSCPSNTAQIKVQDYRRVDGVVVSGSSIVCVATDTNQ